MSQLPYLRHDQLDEDAQATWASVVATRGERTIHADGYLTGPFNALLHAPVPGLRISELGAALRWNTSLDQRIFNPTFISVDSEWTQQVNRYTVVKLRARIPRLDH